MIGKVKTLTDLIKPGEMEFDVILEIDWLSNYRAHVDCRGKRIFFKMDGILEFMRG